MSATRPRVFSIPAGARFLPSFVAALRAGAVVPDVCDADGPFALADTTIYVPTRRAARALAAEFAVASGASLLPRIKPLGAVDEDAELFAAAPDEAFGFAADLPEPVPDIRRRFMLAELVLAWSRSLKGAIVEMGADGALRVDPSSPILVGATPADAVALAGELGKLIDEFVIEGAPWSAVRNLAADDYDRYWGVTTEFLKIAIEAWPKILEENDLIDAVDRRARLIEREIDRLQGAGSDEPTIVLGSTGTNAATARLMRAIARTPRGAVVLPGLDLDMREADWRIVAGSGADARPAFGHPQAALARLVRILECAREDVRVLGDVAPAVTNRMRFVSQALAPEESTGGWRAWRDGRDAEIAQALDRVSLIEAPDETSEALAIAVRLRAALETPDVTAALVTPDRAIARRVQAELRRWNIDIDDSGGEPLGQTPAGAMARAALAAAIEGSDVATAALLAHDSVAPARDRATTARLARLFEIGVLRATPHDPDTARRVGFARETALTDYHAHPAARRMRTTDWDGVAELAAALNAALAPLRDQPAQASVGAWTRAHREVLGRLSTHAELAATDDRDALETLFGDIAGANESAPGGFEITLDEYARLFDTLAAGVVVRGPQRSHPRLKILGPLEARLLDVDLVVLAGLDEAVWPPQPKSDPFLNRPMRAQLGLTPPERRIGQSAHDFWMGLGAPTVVLTRAAKRAGAPTVASRFLQRMAALAGPAADALRARGKQWLALAALVDKPGAPRPLAKPAPKPPLELRPRSLSVTRIETLRRDPYAVYAERILKLAPLGALDGVVGAADQGVALHEVLHEIARQWPQGELPADARATLEKLAREKLVAFFADPAWEAFRWPRIVAGLDYVLAYEAQRRPALARVHGEVAAEATIDLPGGGEFTLSARADRIEIDRDGKARIVDYKTGAAPSVPQVTSGFASQITLEATLLAKGAFDTIDAAEATSGVYLKLGGAGGGRQVDIFTKDVSFADIAASHWTMMLDMLASWREPSRGYASRPYVQFASAAGDYDHLARVKEWSASGGAGGGEA
jgi:ATP-dependent helicase/nuclease subunit B